MNWEYDGDCFVTITLFIRVNNKQKMKMLLMQLPVKQLLECFGWQINIVNTLPSQEYRDSFSLELKHALISCMLIASVDTNKITQERKHFSKIHESHCKPLSC